MFSVTSGSVAQAQISRINSQLSEIQTAREDYKRQALAAKSAGDKETAMMMMKYIKTCDKLADDVKQGQSVDLSIIRPNQVISIKLLNILQSDPIMCAVF